MLEFLRAAQAVHMTREEYKQEFPSRMAQAPAFDFWKLERRQYFAEPWSDSWLAFSRGDWDEVVRLEEAGADAAVAELKENMQRGIRPWRVRVVEMPLSPYMLWELYVFQTQIAAGERIRVIGPEVVSEFEADGFLPELVCVGTDTVYETVFDGDGPAVGAVRYTGTDVVASYTAFMERLWAQGEDCADFFRREVAPLIPSGAGAG